MSIPPREVVVALDETWSALRDVLADLDALGEADWGRPTPCTDWDVRDLAAHLGAVEGQFQGLPQPPTPTPGSASIDAWTAAGIEARRDWTTGQVLDEIAEASTRQLEHLGGLDDEGWQARVPGPVGETTEAMRADIRLMDLYIHLLDLRTALGTDLRLDREPTACRRCVERAVDLTGWGAVKKAGLADGARVRLDLSGPGGRTVDLVVDGGRGTLTEPDEPPDLAPHDLAPHDLVTGPAPAYMLVAAGRLEMADDAGGVVAAGDAARRLLKGYRIFA